MTALTDVPKLDVIYLDSGLYASEGFTSGLLIFLRNMLTKFSDRGLRVGIISLVESGSAKIKDGHESGLRVRKDAGLDVFEYLVPTGNLTSNVLEEKTQSLLNAASPHTIIMNTPAVRAEGADISIREIANSHAAQVIHVLADQLFPTTRDHDVALIERLYKAIGKGEVIGVTAKIRDAFAKTSGIQATPFKTLINPTDVVFEASEYDPRFIGMINLHPLKGISLFDRIAANMPDHSFVVVKNWPDVPPYTPSTDNVEVKDFIQTTRDFYKTLKLLLIPSLLQEGPTMVAMEALLNGIPVIANRIGSIHEAGGDAIRFVEPPIILGNRQEGTILYPICDEESFDRSVQAYCSEIKTVLQHTDNAHRAYLKAAGNEDVKLGHRMMDDLVTRWTENIPRLRRI